MVTRTFLECCQFSKAYLRGEISISEVCQAVEEETGWREVVTARGEESLSHLQKSSVDV